MKSLAKALGAVRGWAQGPAAGGVLPAMLRQGFDWAYGKAVNGMPGVEGAEELALRYRQLHATPDEAVAALIAWQTGVAGAAGFVTGCGGFVALPVAMPANLASALYIQARLIAAIAHLRGHDITSPDVRTLALACMTGSKAADTLKDAGVRFGTRMTRDAVGWASPALFKKVERVAGVSATCAAGAGNAAKFGKFVPVVGGVVAAGFDAAMTQLIGRTADRVFKRASTSPSPALQEKEGPFASATGG
jgi:uncharacterized protein (DUF697 family)